ncbi:MAG: DivIVA domain-containing protein [Zhaonellaceae bacterium]|jgi:cell division initiation protein|nr:DivIVA domain-containing protein [Clostridia bacterium]
MNYVEFGKKTTFWRCKMVLTPLDIQNKQFRKVLRGYSEEEVNVFMSRILRDYEQMFKENQELKEENKKLGSALEQYKTLEDTLNKTLLIAQQTAEEVKENALKECELVQKEHQLRLQEMQAEAEKKLTRLKDEYQVALEKARSLKVQLKSYLLAHLELLEKDNWAEEADLTTEDSVV